MNGCVVEICEGELLVRRGVVRSSCLGGREGWWVGGLVGEEGGREAVVVVKQAKQSKATSKLTESGVRAAGVRARLQ